MVKLYNLYNISSVGKNSQLWNFRSKLRARNIEIILTKINFGHFWAFLTDFEYLVIFDKNNSNFPDLMWDISDLFAYIDLNSWAFNKQ